MQKFMGGIENTVKELVQTDHCVHDEQKSMFGISTRKKRELQCCEKADLGIQQKTAVKADLFNK